MSNLGPANRPTEPEALVLEAWGQGMMVGALVVMAALTIANMRKGVLLHKLILAEVSFAAFSSARCLLMIAVNPRYGPRNLDLYHLPSLRLAPIRDRNATLLLLVTTQCYCMDEEPAVLVASLVSVLHWYCDIGSTILDRGVVLYFLLFQQHRQYGHVSQVKAVGAVISVLAPSSNRNDQG